MSAHASEGVQLRVTLLCDAGRGKPEDCFRKSFTSFVSLWSLASICYMTYPTLECKASTAGNRGGISNQAELVLKMAIKGSCYVAYYLSLYFSEFSAYSSSPSFRNILFPCSFCPITRRTFDLDRKSLF